MKRRILLAYQLMTGLSDTATGILLIFAPALTLHLMGLHADPANLPFLSYIGAFVLSVGLACFYGALLITRSNFASRLKVVWVITAITRTSVALLIAWKIASGIFESGWSTVAISDGALALIQWIGLTKNWVGDDPA
jgi:hypothetical protein